MAQREVGVYIRVDRWLLGGGRKNKELATFVVDAAMVET